MKPRTILLLVALLALGLALTGAAQAAPTDPGITVSFQRSGPADAISSAPFTSRTTAGPQSGATATPHPILSDVRVRQAIAYCTDKAVILASVYPSLTPEQRQALIADTFIRPSSWAYTAPATTYPYAPATGQALLDQAGWILEPGATYRTRGGKELVLTLRTTDSPFRITFLTVFETQMQACGIRVIREHLDMNWFFGKHTGIQVRDFELSDFAWMIPDSEPAGQTIYACDQIPTPVNGWHGENFPGWCNASASTAITTATNRALGQTERKAAYAVVINAAATDLPQLPLFWRDDGTGHPSETWEHIDFNLETYSQDAEADAGDRHDPEHHGLCGQYRQRRGPGRRGRTKHDAELLPTGRQRICRAAGQDRGQTVPADSGPARGTSSLPLSSARRLSSLCAMTMPAYPPSGMRRPLTCTAGSRAQAGSRPRRAARKANVITRWNALQTPWWFTSAI